MATKVSGKKATGTRKRKERKNIECSPYPIHL